LYQFHLVQVIFIHQDTVNVELNTLHIAGNTILHWSKKQQLTPSRVVIVAFKEDVGLLLFQLWSFKSDVSGKYNRVLAHGFHPAG
jgi:hypothetical protein